jgi:minor histocompatibility antigen H13
MITLATFIIWYASRRSNDNKEMETMSTTDAMKFPIVGSCVLFGLFLLFKFFAKEYLNLLFSFYFLLLGFYATAVTLLPFLEFVIGAHKKGEGILTKFTIPKIPFLNDEECPCEITRNEMICYVIGLIIAVWYFCTKHWLANDILGISFCIQAIEMMSLGSFKNGTILLLGLFVYDIFWVFGTGLIMKEGNSVMVSVAKNFDAPIKLLFPKTFPPPDAKSFSMLGLGDIVIPGIFVALSYRYGVNKGKTSFVFQWTLFGYILGLVATVLVMHVFRAAQPALLYIVPACLATAFGSAQYKGKFKDMWAYTEGDDKETEKKNEKSAEKSADKKDN